MLIEVHLTPEETLFAAQHLKSCDNPGCRDVAHLCSASAEPFGPDVELFAFVARSPDSHTRRRRLNRERATRDSERARLQNQQHTSLAVIRRAWDRLTDFGA